jgi:hypothetical protein
MFVVWLLRPVVFILFDDPCKNLSGYRFLLILFLFCCDDCCDWLLAVGDGWVCNGFAGRLVVI